MQLLIDYFIARILVIKGEYDSAKTRLEVLLSKSPIFNDAREELIRISYLQGDLLDASAKLTDLYELYPHIVRLQELDYLLREDPNNSSRIIELLDKHDLLSDNIELTRFRYAIAAVEEQNYPSSERELLLSLALNPSQPKARYYLASVLVSTGRKHEAINQLRLVNSSDEMYTEALIFASFIHRDLKQLDKAEQAIRTALASRPNDSNLRTYYVEILREKEDYVGAAKEVRRMLVELPQDERLNFLYAVVLDQAGDIDEAFKAMKTVLRVNPKNYPSSQLHSL